MSTCINCKASDQSSSFCTNCHHIVPIAADANYFELFGLPQAIDIEDYNLQATYFDLQSSMHPDKFTNRSKAELEIAVANLAAINIAYKVLSNKFDRVEYLVSLNIGLEAKVSDDFMEKSFDLYESKSLGNNIVDQLKVIENSLWLDIIIAIQSLNWKKAAIIIAELKIIMKMMR